MSYSIISWNVNGVRSVQKKNKLGVPKNINELNVLEQLIQDYKPNLICLQETKYDSFINLDNYKCYYNPCKTKKGYSSVAIYTNIEPINVYYDFTNFGIECQEIFNNEGRVITIEFENCYIINTYVPNSKEHLERLDERCSKWEVKMREYIKKLSETKKVILCGDLNVAPDDCDIFDKKYNKRYPGFTIEERTAFKVMLSELDMIDAYRYKYPNINDKFTYWSNMNKSRESNKGWRIDFFIIPENIKENIKEVDILDNIYGSDHCPIILKIDI